MSKITELVEKTVTPFLEENNLKFWASEFVKEGKDWFLRVYIDKDLEKDDEAKYISTDECEMVSRYLSEKLDELDPIEQNYYLEVSSPGMDRELIKPEHFRRYIGEMVEIRLYKALAGKKEFEGKLIARADDGTITIDVENSGEIKIDGELISKVKLAVIF